MRRLEKDKSEKSKIVFAYKFVIIITNLDKDKLDLYNGYNNNQFVMEGRTMKLIELSEVEILIMKSIWKLRDGITVYEIIDYLDQVYDRKYTRSTVKTYITKLKKKGFVDTQVKGNYSYITAKITEEMYREEQMELMKDFWHDGSMKELVQTLTHTISKEEKEELKDLIDDLDD